MIGFTYNSKHSYNDYGIIAKSVNRPLLPNLIKKEVITSGKSGSWDFNSNQYENRIITVDISNIETSIENLRINARNLASWLSQTSYKQLIFDDEPTKYYLAKVYSAVDFENIKRLGKGKITFECQPFAISTVAKSQTIIV